MATTSAPSLASFKLCAISLCVRYRRTVRMPDGRMRRNLVPRTSGAPEGVVVHPMIRTTNRRRLVAAAALLTTFVVGACSDDDPAPAASAGDAAETEAGG